MPQCPLRPGYLGTHIEPEGGGRCSVSGTPNFNTRTVVVVALIPAVFYLFIFSQIWPGLRQYALHAPRLHQVYNDYKNTTGCGGLTTAGLSRSTVRQICLLITTSRGQKVTRGKFGGESHVLGVVGCCCCRCLWGFVFKRVFVF